MTVANPNNHRFYVKPLSHHLWMGVTSFGTILQKKANDQLWHGKVLINLSKGIVATGYILNIIVASIELFATKFFIGFSLIAYSITKCQSHVFQKLCFESIAYWHHNLSILALQITCLRRGFFSNKHTLNAYISHSIYMDSAMMSAVSCRLPYEHQWRYLNLHPENEREFAILMDASQNMYNDMLKAARKDLPSYNFSNRFNVTFVESLRQRQQFQNLVNNSVSIRNLNGLMRNYLVERLYRNLQVHRHEIENVLEVNPHLEDYFYENEEVVLQRINRVQDNESDDLFRIYQNKLKTLIETAFIELHDSPLVSLLSDKTEGAAADGQGILKMLLAIPQFANYAQLEEIKSPITCPLMSSPRLNSCAQRQEMLHSSKAIWNSLSSDEKDILIKKLLKLGSYDLSAQGLTENRLALIQRLFNQIGLLSGQLHQGPLLLLGHSNIMLRAIETAIARINNRRQ